MRDMLVLTAVRHGDDPEISDILEEVCQITGMGFAAVARVTGDSWIACQVLDQIEFGMTPGGELDVSTTICGDIRDCGERVVIDHVAEDQDWRTHPTPILYGFQSYASFPLRVGDGFYGTLCAIDPHPRRLQSAAIISAIEQCARRVEAILSRRIGAVEREGDRLAG